MSSGFDLFGLFEKKRKSGSMFSSRPSVWWRRLYQRLRVWRRRG
ncbi:calcineurin B-like protein-interacting protein kinase [Senna tora]|uniref:Calcineurin B-like protein-interacting protein kinase n=1 Tax=Senna tora TaxID=362788 RepID=A0A834TFI4_9FABA|nr:calcineurin B-like protein-interacting protein kinase [Senna tora]